MDSFLVIQKIQSAEEIKKLVPGSWLTTDKVTIIIEADGNGNWEQPNVEFDFTWNLKESTLTIKNKNGKEIVLEIIKISDHLITFIITDQNGNDMFANACRI